MNNPYQDSNSEGVFQAGAQGLQANSNAQFSLFSSKGWVRFLSVLGFICFAFMLIGTISTLTMIGLLGGIGVLSFLLMGVMTVVTFMLALRLSKFASAIGRMQITGQPIELETAMIEQMKFWRLSGILTLIWLVLALIGLITGLMA